MISWTQRGVESKLNHLREKVNAHLWTKEKARWHILTSYDAAATPRSLWTGLVAVDHGSDILHIIDHETDLMAHCWSVL